jgi:cell division protein FtsL
MKRVPTQEKFNSRLRRERDSISLVRLTAVLACGLILALGFIRAAAQHTTALRFGYESETLRRERERLIDEQNRLLAERDAASSPSRLETAARHIGLEQARSAQISSARPHMLQPLMGAAANNDRRASSRLSAANEVSRRAMSRESSSMTPAAIRGGERNLE